MKKLVVRGSGVAVIALLIIAGFVIANPDWAANSPSKSQLPGGIVVQGTITPDAPYQTSGSARVNYWPVGGGPKSVAAFLITAGQTGLVTWGPYTLSGLNPGQQYNFCVEIDVMDPNTFTTVTYETDTKQQTSP